MLMTVDRFIKRRREFPNLRRPKGNQGNKKARIYKKQICAFDIETSKIQTGEKWDVMKGINAPVYQGFMYIWQFHIEDVGTIVGRSWVEFQKLLDYMQDYCGEREYFVILVHNLSFEFQFLAGVYNFTDDEVFCVDSRKILRCDMYGHFEFRCSYLHSNMSLKEYTNKWNVKHKKLSGEDFNYNIVRYPWSKLTYEELKYCINDVRGLVEAYRAEIEFDNDTLYTVPLTSTGYVRRDEKKAMRTFNWDTLRRLLPYFEVFEMLREAFRGGNVHANRYYTNMLLKDVNSADECSAYPGSQINDLYPMGRWEICYNPTWEYVSEMLNKRKKALLMRVRFSDIALKDSSWGCPYLAYDKCRNVIDFKLPKNDDKNYIYKKNRHGKTVRKELKGYWTTYDNGRIIAAKSLETTITDIDLRIIMDEYNFSGAEVLKMAYCTYGKLPGQYTDVIKEYFKTKTELSGSDDPVKQMLRMKSKNKLNAIYGMSVQNPAKPMMLFKDRKTRTPEEQELYKDELDDFVFDQSKTPEELLEKNNKNAFSSYAWGVFCTAHARRRLEDAIKLVHEQGFFVYCDTDSVKYQGDVDWSKLNSKIKRESKKNGGYAVDPSGKTVYVSVFEYEGKAKFFKTLGAKKYCYIDAKGNVNLTCAGVNKKKGAEELIEAAKEKYGDKYKPENAVDEFADGFTFKKGGGTEAIYNDDPDVKELIIEGHKLEITRNVVINDSTYTLGATDEFFRLLQFPDLWLTVFNDNVIF